MHIAKKSNCVCLRAREAKRAQKPNETETFWGRPTSGRAQQTNFRCFVSLTGNRNLQCTKKEAAGSASLSLRFPPLKSSSRLLCVSGKQSRVLSCLLVRKEAALAGISNCGWSLFQGGSLLNSNGGRFS